jgi:hypothetical protein
MVRTLARLSIMTETETKISKANVSSSSGHQNHYMTDTRFFQIQSNNCMAREQYLGLASFGLSVRPNHRDRCSSDRRFYQILHRRSMFSRSAPLGVRLRMNASDQIL